MNVGYCQKGKLFSTSDYILALKQATDVMVTDVTSPVAASRYYGYINLAAIETAALFDHQQPHFAGILKGLNNIIVMLPFCRTVEECIKTLNTMNLSIFLEDNKDFLFENVKTISSIKSFSLESLPFFIYYIFNF